MTERERWVVYPLLFLSLGAALRDKLVDRTTTKSIRCQELVIEDEPGHPLAKLGVIEAKPPKPAFGFLYMNGAIDVKGDVQVAGDLHVVGNTQVSGVLNAMHYAYQNFFFMPLAPPVPGMVIPNPNMPRVPQPDGQNPPRAAQPKRGPKSASPSPPAAEKQSPAK